jgi:hypothetical protein
MPSRSRKNISKNKSKDNIQVKESNDKSINENGNSFEEINNSQENQNKSRKNSENSNCEKNNKIEGEKNIDSQIKEKSEVNEIFENKDSEKTEILNVPEKNEDQNINDNIDKDPKLMEENKDGNSYKSPSKLESLESMHNYIKDSIGLIMKSYESVKENPTDKDKDELVIKLFDSNNDNDNEKEKEKENKDYLNQEDISKEDINREIEENQQKQKNEGNEQKLEKVEKVENKKILQNIENDQNEKKEEFEENDENKEIQLNKEIEKIQINKENEVNKDNTEKNNTEKEGQEKQEEKKQTDEKTESINQKENSKENMNKLDFHLNSNINKYIKKEDEQLSNDSETNKTKIRKSILKMQNRADYYIEKLFKLKTEFLKIKEGLIDKENFSSLYSSILLFFGFDSYEHLKKSNFFILSSQAWIVEVLRVLEDYINSSLIFVKEEKEKENRNKNKRASGREEDKEKEKEKEEEFLHSINKSPKRKISDSTNNDILLKNFPENFTFANILKRIMKIKINEKEYLTNLKILTGSIFYISHKSATMKLIENNIGKLFLNSLYSISEYFIFNENHSDEELDFKKFEQILMQVLLKAIEKTLNLMDNPGIKEDDYSYIKYLNLFEKLKLEEETKNKEEIKKKNYKKYYELLDEEFKRISNDIFIKEKINSKIILSEKSLDIFAESFFYFSLNNFEDVISDLNKFIAEFNSLTLRTQSRLMRLTGNIYHINKKFFILSKAILVKSIRKIYRNSNVLKEKINNHLLEYKQKYPNVINFLEEKKNSTKKNIGIYKDWINSNLEITKNKTLKYWENNLLDKYIYASEKLFFPLMKISNNNINNIGLFIYSNGEKITKTTFYFLNNNFKFLLDSNLFIIKNWNKFYRFAYEKIKELRESDEKSQIKLNTHEKNEYFVISFNKKFIGNIIKKAFNFTNDITKFSVNSYKNIKSLPCDLVELTFVKTNQIKDFVVMKYDEIIKTEEDI